MRPVIWSAKAEQDFLSILEYIGERNPFAAEKMEYSIRSSTWTLQKHPYLYRRSDRVPGCREIVAHRNYIVVYRVEEDCIRVVRVLHTSRIHF